MHNTCFLRQKCVDTSYAWCLNDFGARFDEFFFWIWGLDGSGMEVDEKIVCRESRWLFHLMKNIPRQLTTEDRGFPRQLNAAGFWIPRRLTAEWAKTYFTRVALYNVATAIFKGDLVAPISPFPHKNMSYRCMIWQFTS